jgi:prepilin-type N-terminal cleavage/methylation domain-containing protein
MTHLFSKEKSSRFAVESIITVSSPADVKDSRIEETGFSLVEVSIAMVIILIALLGVFVTFTYAISYNAGNNSRSQALAVLQQEVELLRSAKFTPTVTDSYTPGVPDDGKRDIRGGTKANRTVSSADGNKFVVETKIDNDPLTEGIQSTNEATTTIKEITVTVTLDSPTPGWQTSVPATVVLRRVRGN